jgi:Bacterial regulatory proteins, gntR family
MERAAQVEAAGGQAALAACTKPDLVTLERARTALGGPPAEPGTEDMPGDNLTWVPAAWTLLDGIQAGHLTAGDIIPSARNLAAELGTTAAAVGRALEVLTAAGALHRTRPQYGTYYVAGTDQVDLTVVSFADQRKRAMDRVPVRQS